ncbi:Ssy5p KNAG_0C02500 [Huiozyma naganishii CBS 8797]|uniref:SPS-sensor serine protease component SSY5 n=1 Tax=Huiozyma naganishii (strain ATCC MYA-139 / BCRC 22969 / CBS 8797 / KCTC 17520 / NBRC 10181 / NCYC 3082 / Yp74L-3) TaxID=1071383 RepID=J7S5T3_HUIN7|nr:hypothetical protein KNAG_0C02500 [Kazachstania naganishii CBS 8797]CCK69361.1 hypothetical protein KNAG_0C02500 [Kazachstania naganishii CBS 8797]
MAGKLFNIGRRTSRKDKQDVQSSSDTPDAESQGSSSRFGQGDGDSPNVVNNPAGQIPEDTASTRFSDKSSSIFSRGRTANASSKNSSNMSGARSASGSSKKVFGNTYNDLGKPLRVVTNSEPFGTLSTVLEEKSKADFAKENSARAAMTSTHERETSSLPERAANSCQQELFHLETNLMELMDDVHQNVLNISKAIILAIEFFKDFLSSGRVVVVPNISSENSSNLRNISKIVFHFLDNLLVSDGFSNSRSILLKRYVQFLKKLNIDPMAEREPGSNTLPYLMNFCIDENHTLPNTSRLTKLMEEILKTDSSIISDQTGAFIAPIRRGLCQRASVLSIVFGIPNLQQEHYEMIKVLYSMYPDVHLYLTKDSIKPCAKVQSPLNSSKFQEGIHGDQLSQTALNDSFGAGFSPPYRIAENPLSPPISMSISTMDSSQMTGTLGGYVFPQIDKTSKFSAFSGASFAITSAHVLLTESQDYQDVSVPSSVLQKAYLATILKESKKYPENSQERMAFVKEAQKIKEQLKWHKENKFGQIVWGERSMVNQKLSDISIIKVNPTYKCENHIGNNAKFISDPTLRFQNNYVKKKIMKIKAGLKVFKIGASSNYTSGQVNGTRLVYWADGKLQSSEFVVASPSPLFAAAGDSGSWILAKSEDQLGLGVVGMLHSYDGANQQFGLFTPIDDILERLHDVTGVHWDIEPELD